MTDWQPIETAPKDGTTIIVHGEGAREHMPNIAVVFWVNQNETKRTLIDSSQKGDLRTEVYRVMTIERGYWGTDTGEPLPRSLLSDITHWMPLPASPRAAE